MQGLTWITLTVATMVALAGCAQKKNDDTGDDEPPMTDVPGTYTLTTTGVPSQATPGVAFTFTLDIAGPAVTSDHIGGHWDSTADVAAAPERACGHTPGDVPGTFDVTCTIAQPGTWHLRGHMRLGTEGNYTHFWGPDNTVTVGTGALTTLRVGTDAAFPPFEELNTTTGEYEGFDMDLMREVGKRAGYVVEFQNLGFDPLIPAIQNGQIDAAISAMSITDARSEQVDFSIAYYEANQSVTVRAADEGKYGDLESMKGKGLKFGAQTGTVGADKVIENFGEGALTRYDTYPLAIEALKRGDVDAVVMDQPAQKAAAKQDSAIVVAFSFDVGDVYGIAMKKGNAALVTKVNAALATIFADGTYDELREKWDV